MELYARLFAIVVVVTMIGCANEEAKINPPTYDYCDEMPPDEPCYATKRDPNSPKIALARLIADKQITVHPPESLEWDWGDATLMLSLVELYRVTGETTYRDYLKGWIDYHLEQGYEIHTSDKCPPALTALLLYQEFGDAEYRSVVEDVLDYLENRALQTEEGGISHLGTVDVFGRTLWLDSLFMFGNVLTRWGEVQDDTKALDLYTSQFSIFTELLQRDSGFFFHAYNWVMEQEEGIFWARGNGWVAASGFEHLRVRYTRNESSPKIQKALKRLLGAIVESQDPTTGLWWTVLTRPNEIYLETSASALFTYALARAYRYGFVGDDMLPIMSKALAGIIERIEYDEQGQPIVTGISGPTNAGNFETYQIVPLSDDLDYGLGSVILALIETSGLPLESE